MKENVKAIAKMIVLGIAIKPAKAVVKILVVGAALTHAPVVQKYNCMIGNEKHRQTNKKRFL